MSGLISYNIPNLSGGVSQQPPALRLNTSCEQMVNAWPSVVSGLGKRPPTEHIRGLILNSGTANIAGHIVNRGANYQYLITLDGKTLRVTDLNGNPQAVSFPNGMSYLSAVSPIDSFEFLTFGDYTFILNKSVVVRANEFGEAGEAVSWYPNGTVTTYADLFGVASPSVGWVYYVVNEGAYYRFENLTDTPAIYGWISEGSGYSYVPNGYSIVRDLPPTASEGQKIAVENVRYETQWIYDRDSASGGYYENVAFISYSLWRAGVTTPAVPGGTGWVKRTFAEAADIATTRRAPDNLGTIYVTQSYANTNYSVYINGSLKANMTTNNGVDANNAVQGTGQIASALATGLQNSGYTVELYGSTILITNLQPTDTITTKAGNGDKALRAYKDTVQTFTDLPPNEAEGRIVKVLGDVDTQGDDYYVMYSNNVWEETVGYNKAAGIYDTTMPHVLIRNADNTFTFKPHNWDNRIVGDEESSKHPSFIGRTINDMFIYNNRLGFLSDENVILSEADNFENFYRTTVVQVLDSDPLDYAVFNKNVDILRHAVPFNKDILLMSDRSQFRLSFQNYVGPKNVNVNYTTTFNVSPRCSPINMGGSVFFVDDMPGYGYAKVFEYYPRDDVQTDDAEEVTAPIPEYIPAGVMFVTASPRMKMAVLNTYNRPDRLYVYKYYWGGDKKIQNAWGYWDFPGATRILWADFLDNNLYIIIERYGGYWLERIRVDEDVYTTPTASTIYLDRRVAWEGSALYYNALTNETSVYLPYWTADDIEVLTSDEENGQFIRHAVTPVWTDTNYNQFKIKGNYLNSKVVAGVKYEFKYEFSKQYMKQKTRSGESLVLEGRMQLRYMSLEYHNSVSFRVTVERPGSGITTIDFDGSILGSEAAILGQPGFASGTLRVALMANAQDAKVTIYNDTPFNSWFGTASYQAFFVPKAQPI